MLSLTVLALTTALLCWPAGRARPRLAALQPTGPRRRWPVLRPGPVALVLAGAAAGVLLAGAGGGIAGALAAATGSARWRVRCDRVRGAAAAAGLVEALGLLVAELRAGAHPAHAAESAAHDAHPAVAHAFAAVAGAARLGGDVAAVLGRTAGTDRALAAGAHRIAAAWMLAERHGVPLAGLLEATRTDLDERLRFRSQVQARLAGPRATAAVLAALPVLGILLGEAVGARPWQVLSGSGAGQVLLVVGTGLVCAGVVWSARMVAKVLPS